MGRPRKSEARDVRTLLLEEAARVVSESGEQALRTKLIAASVGVTEPALFHYFGNREGLIEEVQARRFELTQIDLFVAFRDAVMKCSSKQQFASTVVASLRATFAPGRAANRAARINIAGSSVSRPQLRARLAQAQKKSVEAAVDALEYARERGWTRPDLNSEAFSYWIVAQSGGRYFAELEPNAPLLKELNETILRATLFELGLDPSLASHTKARAPRKKS